MSDRAGFFGKMPATGDFVSRNLPPGLRPALDRWLVAHVMDAGHDWPATGLRGLVEIGGRRVLLLALPSCDRLGREYPLVALADGSDVARTDADRWCDAVLPDLVAAQAGEMDAWQLDLALAAVAPPDRAGHDADGVWAEGSAVRAPSAETVRALLSSD